MYLCLFVCFDVLTYLTNPFTDLPQILIGNSVEPREYELYRENFLKSLCIYIFFLTLNPFYKMGEKGD